METENPEQLEGTKEAVDDNDQLDLSNLKKKKKKKKKTEFSLDANEQAKPVESQEGDGEKDESAKPRKVTFGPLDDEENLDEELDLGKKKKKKTKKIIEETETKVADDVIDMNGMGMQSWHGTDRDYTYDELLTRVFDIIRQKNPEMVAGEKKKFVMKPPQCARVGTKKTSFVNFTEICQMLHRQPKHILAFILAELGASGSVDGNNQLIIKGRFQQKQLESVLRRYIKEYVTCHTCRSPDTLLERDVRLYFLRCRVCQSSCSVAAIKSGFQAVTGKRARMRAKANS